MMGTINCTYETPCGYCTKWDKKCDTKIPERGLRSKINPIDDYSGTTSTNKICQTEEDHQWVCCGISTAGSTYRCKVCGEHKSVPIGRQDNVTISTYYHKDSDLDDIKSGCGLVFTDLNLTTSSGVRRENTK